MFEKATRKKIRFDFKGKISVEDLWDLSRKDLNTIFQNLDAEMRSIPAVSLLDDDANNKKKRAEIQLKIDLVQHVNSYKKTQEINALARQQAITQRNRLLEEKAKRQAGEVGTLSLEDLDAQLAQTNSILDNED